MQEAKQTIFNQEDMPLSVKRSAWTLFQHQLGQINPATAKPYTPRKALSNVLKWMAIQKSRHEEGLKRLTATHKKILHLLATEGLTHRQIAYRLGSTPRMIKWHYAQIREHLHVDSMHQAVAIAVFEGWISLPPVND